MTASSMLRAGSLGIITCALTAVALTGTARAAAPVEMQFACALKSNGLLRYVTNLNQCKKTETKVTVKPGPNYVCVQPSGSSRLVSGPLACPPEPTSRRPAADERDRLLLRRELDRRAAPRDRPRPMHGERDARLRHPE